MERDRFLVIEKEVLYKEDLILDIPLSLEIEELNGILVSANCTELTTHLNPHTHLPLLSETYGYDDFIRTITVGSKSYNPAIANFVTQSKNYFSIAIANKPDESNGEWFPDPDDPWVENQSQADDKLARAILLYLKSKILNPNSKFYENSFPANEPSAGYIFNNNYLELDTLGNWIWWIVKPNEFEKYLSTQFNKFSDINVMTTHLIGLNKTFYTFDYARYLAGTVSVSLNGDHIILRNSRVTVNQMNKTLQNNLIDVGAYKVNGGFLRCVFFQKNGNMNLEAIPRWDYATSQFFDSSKMKIKIKIYLKYKKAA